MSSERPSKGGGPPPSLVGFCQREHGRLVGALELYTGNVDVARELAQDALLQAAGTGRA